jgi:hypothetical protein
MLGVDPSPYTLRELAWMRDGKEKADWIHTTAMVITIANCNRDPKTKPLLFEDVYPFYDKAAPKVEKTEAEYAFDREVAKAMFLKAVEGQKRE